MRVALYIIITIGLLLTAIYKVGTREGWLDDLLSQQRAGPAAYQQANRGALPESPPVTSREVSLPSPLEEGDEISRMLEAKELFLAKLPPIEAKGGWYAADVFNDVLITTRGREFRHSVHFRISEYGFEADEGYVEYNILGKFSTLELGFGYDDNHPGEDKQASCSLTVVGDGQALWESNFVDPYDFAVFESIDISNVFRLKLVVTRIWYEKGKTKYENKLSPAVLDPLLKK